MECSIADATSVVISILGCSYICLIDIRLILLGLLYSIGLIFPYAQQHFEGKSETWTLTASTISTCVLIIFVFVSLKLAQNIRTTCRAVWLIAIVASAITHRIWFNKIPIIPASISDITLGICIISFVSLLLLRPYRTHTNNIRLNYKMEIFVQLLLAGVSFSYRLDEYIPTNCKRVLTHVFQAVTLVTVSLLKTSRISNQCWSSLESRTSDLNSHIPANNLEDQMI